MTEGKRMAALYREIYEGDSSGEAWHGPALKPLLKGVSAEMASRAPSAEMHSILQLVLHIAYWEEVVLRRFNGEIVEAPLNSPDDWPATRKLSDAEWQAVLTRLNKSHNAMQKAIDECPDEKLSQRVPTREHDFYILLHGIIDHCVYHSAQIALVKKAIGQKES